LISSRANPRLKRARRLQGRRARALSGLFVAEGEDLLEAALAAGIAPVEVLAAPEANVPVEAERVDPKLLTEVSMLGHGSRVIALFRMADLPALAVGEVTVELHDVHDPGNVGAVLRSAAALGPASVLLGPGCADPLGPRAVRASMGAVFVTPLLTESPATRRVALAADAGADLATVDLTGPVTVVLGGERAGLPDAVRAGADVVARIPQTTAIDSLNVAMAATVALYEARRQRA
jgi:RNA methyltransferase, TrmH family